MCDHLMKYMMREIFHTQFMYGLMVKTVSMLILFDLIHHLYMNLSILLLIPLEIVFVIVVGQLPKVFFVSSVITPPTSSPASVSATNPTASSINNTQKNNMKF